MDEDFPPAVPPHPGPLTWVTLAGAALGLLGSYAALIWFGFHTIGPIVSH